MNVDIVHYLVKYPSGDLLQEFPRSITLLRVTVRSLFSSLKESKSPIFYLLCDQFSVVLKSCLSQTPVFENKILIVDIDVFFICLTWVFTRASGQRPSSLKPKVDGYLICLMTEASEAAFSL